MDLVPTQIIQNDLILRPLITSAKTLSPNKILFTGWGLGQRCIYLTHYHDLHFSIADMAKLFSKVVCQPHLHIRT